MDQTFIEERIKKTGLTTLVTNLILLIVAAAIIYFARINIFNIIQGPFQVSNQDFQQLCIDQNSWKKRLNVQLEETLDTGLALFRRTKVSGITVHKSKKPSSVYVAYPVKDQYILIQVPVNFQGDTYRGIIVPLQNKLKRVLPRADEDSESPVNQDNVLSVVFDCTAWYFWTYVLLAIAVIFILTGVINIINFIRRQDNPSLHPIYKDLEKYGSRDSVALNINQEVKTSRQDYDNIILTKNWLIQLSSFSTEFFKIADIVWFYIEKKQTKNQVEYIVHVMSRTGDKITETYTDNARLKAEQAIEELQKRLPWAVSGWAEELEKLYDTDLPDFIRQVEKRKTGNQGSSI